MLTAELKVNGCLIAHIYIVNKRPVHPHKYAVGKDDTCRYSYEIYFVGEEPVKKGYVNHKRSDGALKLIALVQKDIEKNKGT